MRLSAVLALPRPRRVGNNAGMNGELRIVESPTERDRIKIQLRLDGGDWKTIGTAVNADVVYSREPIEGPPLGHIRTLAPSSEKNMDFRQIDFDLAAIAKLAESDRYA